MEFYSRLFEMREMLRDSILKCEEEIDTKEKQIKKFGETKGLIGTKKYLYGLLAGYEESLRLLNLTEFDHPENTATREVSLHKQIEKVFNDNVELAREERPLISANSIYNTAAEWTSESVNSSVWQIAESRKAGHQDAVNKTHYC